MLIKLYEYPWIYHYWALFSEIKLRFYLIVHSTTSEKTAQTLHRVQAVKHGGGREMIGLLTLFLIVKS